MKNMFSHLFHRWDIIRALERSIHISKHYILNVNFEFSDQNDVFYSQGILTMIGRKVNCN